MRREVSSYRGDGFGVRGEVCAESLVGKSRECYIHDILVNY